MPDIKVRDPGLLLGQYRESAHQSSNLNVQKGQSSFVAALFHNFGEYDSNWFIKTLFILYYYLF